VARASSVPPSARRGLFVSQVALPDPRAGRGNPVQRSALFIAMALGAPTAANAAYRGPYHRADSSGTVYEVGGLFDTREDFQCRLSPRSLCGIVVKRAFATNAIDVDGVVIENKSGERTFVNINDLPTDTSMAERGWVTQGLQGC
jgi:hypothetical protein